MLRLLYPETPLMNTLVPWKVISDVEL